MKCPFCKNEMVVGSISQDRYALKWVPTEKDMGLLNFPACEGNKTHLSVRWHSGKSFLLRTLQKIHH